LAALLLDNALMVLKNLPPIQQDDHLVFTLNNADTFTLSSGWDWVRDRRNTNSVMEKVWKLSVPHKIKLFIWKLWNSCLALDDRLASLGYHLFSKCSLCDSASETFSHLFVQCPVVQNIWMALAAELGMCHIVAANLSLVDLFRAWWNHSSPDLFQSHVTLLYYL
jgi:hypothetical protein